jgi:hypothetical protein
LTRTGNCGEIIDASAGGPKLQFSIAARIIRKPPLDKPLLLRGRRSDCGYFVIRNSWSRTYGDDGFAYMPVAWAMAYVDAVYTVFDVDLVASNLPNSQRRSKHIDSAHETNASGPVS